MKILFVVCLLLVSAHAATKEVTADGPRVRGSVGKRDLTAAKPVPKPPMKNDYFNRISVFLICSQIDEACDTDEETVAEIVSASDDGMMLVYTDSAQETLGFVDIKDPHLPKGMGSVNIGGEPTSVTTKGEYAIAGVNTSPDFVNPSGFLAIVNMTSQQVMGNCEIDLGGQPDSVAISPDKNYVAVAIENERDEDIEIEGVEGGLPQLPAGYLVIIDTSSDNCGDWTSTVVELTGLNGIMYPDDPEPEFVSINDDNMCVVTLQENNGIVLVDLEKAEVEKSFSAGKVNLKLVDTVEDGVIDQSDKLRRVPREPDGVVWIDNRYFSTADEGDLDGGSRGFTIWDSKRRRTVYEAGSDLEHMTAMIGHYPDERSENKGNEPENVAFGTYGKNDILFVNSERSSVVFVYNVNDPKNPVFVQVLPAGGAPEGGLTIPHRGLLVVASEADSRGDKIRSVLNIYHVNGYYEPDYPTIMSKDRQGSNVPIPFSAMSGLAAMGSSTLYAVEDSFYNSNRIFKIDVSGFPGVVEEEIFMLDSKNRLAKVPVKQGDEDTTFTKEDRKALINNDKTVNLDPEGIAISKKYGGFWVVSEGSGTVSDSEARPINSLNFLLKIDTSGVIDKVYTLPNQINAGQLRFGFEGVAEDGDKVVVAFQRAWTDLGDENPRLGIFNSKREKWEFVFYPLDLPESQNGGWVGLSDISPLGHMKFLVVERDNQGGPDAAIKRLYEIDLKHYKSGETIEKKFVRDLLPDLLAKHGQVYEKIEGSAVTDEGNVWIINDNDGVDDNTGEHQLINLGCLY